MKIAGAVILYNPSEEIFENIETYLSIVEKLYVMDNSTKEHGFEKKFKEIKKVEYITMGGNQGIAKALKDATEKAIEEGYEFILTMDQDSKYPTEDFKYVKGFLENDENSNVGIVGINFEDSLIQSNTSDKNETKEINSLITSGSIIYLSNYHKIEGFNADLFIDFVDDDICYQFILNGFKVIMFVNIYLNHNLGNKQEVNFFGKKMKILVHSSVRYYYMYRNYHYLKKYRNKDYFKLLKEKSRNFDFKHYIKRVVLEKNRFKNFKMIRQGIKDGKKAILGSYQERRNK